MNVILKQVLVSVKAGHIYDGPSIRKDIGMRAK